MGATPSQVALAWLLHKPGVTSCIFGARSEDQLRDNLKAADLKLSGEQLRALDDASSAPLPYPYAMIRNIQGRW